MTDPDHRGTHMDLTGSMSYGDYLHLDAILGAQHPISDAHDEMLFIIQHQASEVWMKLAIHELSAARAAIRSDDLAPAFKMLARVARIFEQLNSAWDVLRTMTPSDYTTFRGLCRECGGNSRSAPPGRVGMTQLRRLRQERRVRRADRGFPIRRPSASGSGRMRAAPTEAWARFPVSAGPSGS